MKMLKEAFKEFIHDRFFWWFLAAFVAINTLLAEINRYLIHIPGWKKW